MVKSKKKVATKKKVAPKKKVVATKKEVGKKKETPKKAHIFIDSKTYHQNVPHDGRRIKNIPPPKIDKDGKITY